MKAMSAIRRKAGWVQMVAHSVSPACFSGSLRYKLFSHLQTSLVRDENGSSLIEFAFCFVILIAFTIGLVQVCFGYYSYNMISELAREGTRYAIVHGSTCKTSAGASCTASVSNVQSAVTGFGLPNLSAGTLTVGPSSAAAMWPGTGADCSGGAGSEAPGCPVKVTVTYVFPIQIPKFSWNTLQLSTTNLTISTSSQMIILQ